MVEQTLLCILKFLEKKCLKIDTRHVNYLEPSKFITGAENDKEQVRYVNHNKKGKAFNKFLAVRKQTLIGERIFSIPSLIDKSNKLKDSFYKSVTN